MKRIAAIVFSMCVAAAGCRSAGTVLTQPGAPGEPSHSITPDEAVDLSRVEFTGDDVKFMQGMIGHHAQALEMTELLATRTHRDDMKKLALRIAVSQEDEILMMQRWLELRRQQVPGRTAMHMHGATLMPGMLTEEEMNRLAAAEGVEFDRLFLEGMIKHHGGALTMVRDLFDTPGAGQDSDVFAFASEVDGDQRMEINRMAAMLTELQK